MAAVMDVMWSNVIHAHSFMPKKQSDQLQTLVMSDQGQVLVVKCQFDKCFPGGSMCFCCPKSTFVSGKDRNNSYAFHLS